MRVLVTGGTGLLGGSLVRRLLSNGMEPRVFARSGSKADLLEAEGVQVVRGDLANRAALATATKGVETVFHCAAQVDPSGPWPLFLESNVRGTQNILQASLCSGVKKFIYVSSLAVYDTPSDGLSVTEQTPHDQHPELRGYYSHSKILAERIAVKFHEQSKLPVVIFRPGIIFGKQRRPPLGLLCFSRGNSSVVVGRPASLFPLNYVENLVDALILAAEFGGNALEEFNLVDDPNLTQREFLKTLSVMIPLRFAFVPGWPFQLIAPILEHLPGPLRKGKLANFSRHQLRRALQSVRYDIRRVRKELGWAPRVSLSEALRRTFQSEILELHPFQAPRVDSNATAQ